MFFRIKRFFSKLGPGFITGASDDDPSGIATYTQVGARFGLAHLWTAFLTLPFMITIQETVARISMVTGEGLTSVLRKHYPAWLLVVVTLSVFLANTINIGANLGAMADVTHLLFPTLPFTVYAIGYAFLILVLEIFITYKTYAKILKWLTLTLFSYAGTAFIVTTEWKEVFQSLLVPHLEFNRPFILGLVAILGTTIAPYLFFWQSNEEVEEEIAHGRKTLRDRRGATPHEIRDMRVDVVAGMGLSNLMMFFILVTAAMTFYKNGLHNIETSAQAAQALTPIAGRYASHLFAIGIIGTGLLAVPILSASASYAVAEAFGWSNGFYQKLTRAHGFYGAITLATLLGLLLNFIGVPPLQALFWTAVLNGLVAPLMILAILLIANNPRIMSKYTNTPIENFFGILTFSTMTIAAALLLFL